MGAMRKRSIDFTYFRYQTILCPRLNVSKKFSHIDDIYGIKLKRVTQIIILGVLQHHDEENMFTYFHQDILEIIGYFRYKLSHRHGSLHIRYLEA